MSSIVIIDDPSKKVKVNFKKNKPSNEDVKEFCNKTSKKNQRRQRTTTTNNVPRPPSEDPKNTKKGTNLVKDVEKYQALSQAKQPFDMHKIDMIATESKSVTAVANAVTKQDTDRKEIEEQKHEIRNKYTPELFDSLVELSKNDKTWDIYKTLGSDERVQMFFDGQQEKLFDEIVKSETVPKLLEIYTSLKREHKDQMSQAIARNSDNQTKLNFIKGIAQRTAERNRDVGDNIKISGNTATTERYDIDARSVATVLASMQGKGLQKGIEALNDKQLNSVLTAATKPTNTMHFNHESASVAMPTTYDTYDTELFSKIANEVAKIKGADDNENTANFQARFFHIGVRQIPEIRRSSPAPNNRATLSAVTDALWTVLNSNVNDIFTALQTADAATEDINDTRYAEKGMGQFMAALMRQDKLYHIYQVVKKLQTGTLEDKQLEKLQTGKSGVPQKEKILETMQKDNLEKDYKKRVFNFLTIPNKKNSEDPELNVQNVRNLAYMARSVKFGAEELNASLQKKADAIKTIFALGFGGGGKIGPDIWKLGSVIGNAAVSTYTQSVVDKFKAGNMKLGEAIFRLSIPPKIGIEKTRYQDAFSGTYIFSAGGKD